MENIMTLKEYQWYISLVQERHQYLHLRFEQAEKIFRYEKDRDNSSYKHYLTVWEEREYERTVYREILDSEQYKSYESFMESDTAYGQVLTEQDNETAAAIPFVEEKLRFYENEFLIALFKQGVFQPAALLPEKSKTAYLRNEYASFLNDTRKRIIVDHFRNYRAFRPNELKLSLLHHQAAYIIPDYFSFRNQMDTPTRVVVEFLLQRYPYVNTEPLLLKLEEVKTHDKALFLRQYGGENTGWHVPEAAPLSPKEARELHTMIWLLADIHKYNTALVVDNGQ
jgi:hypothetical protein